MVGLFLHDFDRFLQARYLTVSICLGLSSLLATAIYSKHTSAKAQDSPERLCAWDHW
jgi:hypothetical protein